MRGCKIKVLLINFNGKWRIQKQGPGWWSCRQDTIALKPWQREISYCCKRSNKSMKKKHLKALNSIEKWLMQQAEVEARQLGPAFQSIRNLLESLPAEEALSVVASGELPAPQEIAHEPATLALFSDGGCRGNPGPGAFAYLIQLHSGAILAQGVEFEGHTTNNKMELMGPLQGLTHLKDILPEQGRDCLLTKVKVITDSKYVVEGMKSWVQGWKARGWRKADGKTPENLELWQRLDEVRQHFMQIEWQWIKGHAGHPQNEYCDRRANEIMDENILS
jgi:ribonuclease HI